MRTFRRVYIKGTPWPCRLPTIQAGLLKPTESRHRFSRDGIGLITVHPRCEGICEVSLVFEGGLERKLCRVTSFGVTIATLLLGIFRLLSSRYAPRFGRWHKAV